MPSFVVISSRLSKSSGSGPNRGILCYFFSSLSQIPFTMPTFDIFFIVNSEILIIATFMFF
jgi:hypothetical protein